MERITITICFLFFAISLSAVQFQGRDVPPVIVDTLYLEREECVVSAVFIAPYGDPNNTYYYFNNPSPSGASISVGDSYSFDDACNSASRIYYTFPMLEGHPGYALSSVQLLVLQVFSSGNSQDNIFPIWGQGESHSLLAAHVNFTQPLTSVSFTPAFCQNIGVISSDAVGGWKSLDVTSYYQYAKEQLNWNSFQLMLYFDILTDWDCLRDNLLIGNPSYAPGCPKLLLTYQVQSANQDETQVCQAPKLNIYPNPARTHTSIKLENGTPISELDLYNLKGQRIESKHLICEKSPGELQLDTQNLPTGVYFIKCVSTMGTNRFNHTQRIMVTH